MPLAIQPRKRPRQARSRAMVDFILDGAVRVLMRDGWARVTTTAVAAAAGVSVGSVYQYFPNREAVLAGVVARYVDGLSATLLAEPLDRGASVEQAAGALMTLLVARKRAGVALATALQPVMPRVEGRMVVAVAVRMLAKGLDDKLAAHPAPAGAARDTRMAMAAVEGILSDLVMRDPQALHDPALPERLTTVFVAAYR
jgi:AcrR family transcriptional regulator